MFDTYIMIHIYIGHGTIYICIIIYESRLFRPTLILRSLHPLWGYICLCVYPPLHRAADGGLYQGRSAGYFIPRPPAVRRLEHTSRARVASSPHPCRMLLLAAPPPICPQRGLPLLYCYGHNILFSLMSCVTKRYEKKTSKNKVIQNESLYFL